MIYLDKELQQQLHNVFRYGLRDDGYLFIGVSEAARLLRISEPSVRYWHKTGRLRAAFRTPTGQRFFWREEVEALARESRSR